MKKQINSLIITAMKAKDVVSLKVLKVLKGEIETTEKRSGVELTDVEVIKFVKKMIESIKESNGDPAEIDVLEQFVPSQLSDDELSTEITNFVTENNLSGIKEMKTVMAHLQANFAGRYDGKTASNLIKEQLL